MGAQHTPGPWQIVIDDTGDRPIAVPSIQAAEEYDCAIVHWDGFWQEHWQSARGNKEMHANARLISAAPELLSVVLDMFENPQFQVAVGGNPNMVDALMERARAAISKATGASS